MITQHALLLTPIFLLALAYSIKNQTQNTQHSFTKIPPSSTNFSSRLFRIDQICQKYRNSPEIKDLRTAFKNLNEKQYPLSLTRIVENRQNTTVRDVFMCIPPKTGTTSWQVFFIRNQYGSKIRPAIQQKLKNLEGALRPLWLNTVTPRFYQYKKTKPELRKSNDKKFYKIMNARHPFERIHSAWHEKFTIHESEIPNGGNKILSKAMQNRAAAISRKMLVWDLGEGD